ncbi:type II toxin-antitoxin system RelE/ParE family toxin [Pseudoxanthomonas koreensis]|uniref:type II toxin-antitoxin system RelE/ParE family toxin n=1 Tax=Pseudoxanthomonas koreensis TaxID=266061 RepID=UPI001390E82B|nr:type II toxin-antitoxin system RelE/ParE family toxin [Pseudoxanthomonas koreensis]KAF1691542.1 plasmid stabilization protein [Pseudoxanthomonas koreensis]
MKPVEFHPEAAAELEAGVRHYEQQQRGLGERFIAAIEFSLSGIIESPHAWPVLERDVRRKLARVFPYAVLYSDEPDRILVLAVMHCHRKPGYWRVRTDR